MEQAALQLEVEEIQAKNLKQKLLKELNEENVNYDGFRPKKVSEARSGGTDSTQHLFEDRVKAGDDKPTVEMHVRSPSSKFNKLLNKNNRLG